MANLSSSKKAIRVSARRRYINVARDLKVKDSVKDIKKLIGAKSLTKEESMNAMQNLQKQLDKAVKTGFMVKNKANRMKSRLNTKLKAVVEGSK
jgi:ribosomal protein S20